MEGRVLGLRELAITYHWKATNGAHPIAQSFDARYGQCTLAGFREWLEYIGEPVTPEEWEAIRNCLIINSTRTADHIDGILSLEA